MYYGTEKHSSEILQQKMRAFKKKKNNVHLKKTELYSCTRSDSHRSWKTASTGDREAEHKPALCKVFGAAPWLSATPWASPPFAGVNKLHQ